jgi:hypothetical protein
MRDAVITKDSQCIRPSGGAGQRFKRRIALVAAARDGSRSGGSVRMRWLGLQNENPQAFAADCLQAAELCLYAAAHVF